MLTKEERQALRRLEHARKVEQDKKRKQSWEYAYRKHPQDL